MLMTTAIGALAPFVPQLAHAQTAASANSDQLQEVVVTAERRSETVQNVPMSITAITSVTIEKFDIQDITDYAKQTPNVSFGLGVGGGGASFSQGVPGALGISIRGISGYDTTSFYIDDTPLPSGLDPRIIDTDHIEVLRGPQGTLFGASSMGGMVRIITQQPNDTPGGSIDMQGYGQAHSSVAGGDANAVFNVPLIKDMASVRLSAFESYQPGYFTRTYNDPQALDVTGQKVTGPPVTVDNVGAVRSMGLGASFKITPIEGLDLTPVVRWQKSDGNGFPLADYTPGNLVQRRILNEPESYTNNFLFTAFTGSYTTPVGRFVSSTSYFTQKTFDTEDGADANSAYLSPEKVLPGPGIGLGHTKTFTEEDRFESNFQLPVQMVAGVFYQQVKSDYYNFVNSPGLNALSGGAFGTDTIWELTASDATSQLAGFVGLTYTPIAPLELQAGGRESRLTNTTYAFSDGIFGTGLGQTHVTENAFTPRFSAKYKFDPDFMVYATAAQGFRIGGANVPIGSACTGFGFSTTQEIPYGSDTLWSYEGGVKSTLLDNRVTLDFDVYHIDWTKIQQTEVLATGANGCFASLTLNLGTAKSDGAELEANARVTDQLTMHLAGGYEDARLTSVAKGTEYYVGEPLSGVPKWTASVSEDYTIPVSWGNYFVRAQYSYTGPSTSYTELATGLPRKSYDLFDLRLGANYHGYTLTLFAKNLFDAKPNLSDEVPVSALAGDRYRYMVGPPREVGVEFRYHWG